MSISVMDHTYVHIDVLHACQYACHGEWPTCECRCAACSMHGRTYLGHNYLGRNVPGHNYPGRNYLGHIYIGRNYLGRNYTGRNYTGRNYIGRNYIGQAGGRAGGWADGHLTDREVMQRTSRRPPSLCFVLGSLFRFMRPRIACP